MKKKQIPSFTKSFLLSCFFVLSTLTALAQQPDTTDCCKDVFDRFGNQYSLDDISIIDKNAPEGTFYHTCDAGIFHLTFRDNTSNLGFSDPTLVGSDTLGAIRRAVICQEFSDLSALLEPAISHCGDTALVEMIVYSLNMASQGNVTVLGIGSSNYYRGKPIRGNITDLNERSGVRDGELWCVINTGVSELRPPIAATAGWIPPP